MDISKNNVNKIMESDSEEGVGDPEIAYDTLDNVNDKGDKIE